MQVTSLFATFFTVLCRFLTLVAPLTTLAMQISIPNNITTGSNATIICTDADDTSGPLTFFLVRNGTRDTIAENALADVGTLTGTIPANATGDGWTIQATSFDGKQVGVSSAFSILASSETGKKSMAVPIIGAVFAAVVVFSLLVLALFFYMRRRRQMRAIPEFNLEANFPPQNQTHQISRSFSSTSTVLPDNNVESKSLEMDKVDWETQLEEQFARARAATPDIRGATPAPRMTTPAPLVRSTRPHAQPELLVSTWSQCD
ncbi:hypothetical protein B0H12DRAFT_722272 [Mycena haematopus]|nr:hypothetical protein B0H12DRAFT_722272 [Mycena haematopus]